MIGAGNISLCCCEGDSRHKVFRCVQQTGWGGGRWTGGQRRLEAAAAVAAAAAEDEDEDEGEGEEAEEGWWFRIKI